MFDTLNDHSGKPFICQPSLKLSKNISPTVVILLVSKDHSGKLVKAQALLNFEKK